jgi:hypothetical protein
MASPLRTIDYKRQDAWERSCSVPCARTTVAEDPSLQQVVVDIPPPDKVATPSPRRSFFSFLPSTYPIALLRRRVKKPDQTSSINSIDFSRARSAATTASSNVRLQDMPIEILSHVIQYLSPRGRAYLASTAMFCKNIAAYTEIFLINQSFKEDSSYLLQIASSLNLDNYKKDLHPDRGIPQDYPKFLKQADARISSILHTASQASGILLQDKVYPQNFELLRTRFLNYAMAIDISKIEDEDLITLFTEIHQRKNWEIPASC